MGTILHSSPKTLTVLLCFILLLTGEYAIAQSTTNTSLGIDDVFYYILGGAIIIVLFAMFFVIRKVARVAVEHGVSMFEIDFPIFKWLAKSSRIVAIIMILLVLWGIYLVVTYKAK